jgi:ribosomal RNA-processing protein 1
LWHADKLIVQAEVASNIASLLHSAGTAEAGMRYLAAGLWTVQQRWQTIDKHRIDKFLSLLRHLLRQALLLLARRQWREEEIAHFAQAMQRFALGRDSTGDLRATPLCPGIALHFADIFMGELQLVRNRHLSDDIHAALCSSCDVLT